MVKMASILTRSNIPRRTRNILYHLPHSTTSTQPQDDGFAISRYARNHLVFGANTDVGKTVITAGLVRASLLLSEESKSCNVNYIKPLQCGGSDESFVEKHISLPLPPSKCLQAQTLFQWDTPASPHVASRNENIPKSDDEVLDALHKQLTDISQQSSTEERPTTTWIETAGGVLSPSSASPSNQSPRHAFTSSDSSSKNGNWGWVTQGDLYQPLIGKAPVILCGDGRLGGISATLSSLESLISRGYDVAGIVLLETGYDNVNAIREYVGRKSKLLSSNGEVLFEDAKASVVALPQLPPEPEPLHEWYASAEVMNRLRDFDAFLSKHWEDRVC